MVPRWPRLSHRFDHWKTLSAPVAYQTDPGRASDVERLRARPASNRSRWHSRLRNSYRSDVTLLGVRRLGAWRAAPARPARRLWAGTVNTVSSSAASARNAAYGRARGRGRHVRARRACHGAVARLGLERSPELRRLALTPTCSVTNRGLARHKPRPQPVCCSYAGFMLMETSPEKTSTLAVRVATVRTPENALFLPTT